MSPDFRDQIYANLNLKETKELLAIWQENDRAAWSDDAFDVIREILQERLGDAPTQEAEMNFPVQTSGRSFSLKKLIASGHLVSGLVCLLAALLFAYIFMNVPEVVQFVNNDLNGLGRRTGRTLVSVIVFICFLGVVGITELFRAWQESTKETRLARRKRRKESRQRKGF